VHLVGFHYKKEISGILCLRIPFLLRRNYTELLSHYLTRSRMLLRGKKWSFICRNTRNTNAIQSVRKIQVS